MSDNYPIVRMYYSCGQWAIIHEGELVDNVPECVIVAVRERYPVLTVEAWEFALSFGLVTEENILY